MADPVTVAVLGAGNRGGDAYGRYIKKHSDDIKIVAVAELDENRRRLFSSEHHIARACQFESWEQLLAEERLADGIIIATMDTMHVEPAIQAIEKGYQILLEKPIAPTLEDTMKIVRKAREKKSTIMIAHVLRYTYFYQQLKKILKEKAIGDIRFVDHIENIGFYHFAHSYVRGNWRNTDVAAPIILAKSCHDLDLIYWLLEEKCISLSSHASLEHFQSKSQPETAADRCLECTLEEQCPYSACKIYLTDNTGWPASVITTDLSYKGRYNALKTGPYGRCVYKCDNNVPEVQTVRMTFENNIEVNFALIAFSSEINRTSRFYGTRGEIRADFEHGIIELYRFGETKKKIQLEKPVGGHGGGDSGLMSQFVRGLKGKSKGDYFTSIEASLESHVMAFAAEKARKEEKLISLDKI